MFSYKSKLDIWCDELIANDEKLLSIVMYDKMKQCSHINVPFIKSQHADVKELVQRGTCPDCGVIMLELD